MLVPKELIKNGSKRKKKSWENAEVIKRKEISGNLL